MRGAEGDSDEKDRGKRSNGEEEAENGDKLKTETKMLWQLRAAWKKAECETARIEVGSSIKILVSQFDKSF